MTDYSLIYRSELTEDFSGFVLEAFKSEQNKYAVLKECKGRHSLILSFQSDIPLSLLRNLVFLLGLGQDLASSVTLCLALALLSH